MKLVATPVSGTTDAAETADVPNTLTREEFYGMMFDGGVVVSDKRVYDNGI